MLVSNLSVSCAFERSYEGFLKLREAWRIIAHRISPRSELGVPSYESHVVQSLYVFALLDRTSSFHPGGLPILHLCSDIDTR